MAPSVMSLWEVMNLFNIAKLSFFLNQIGSAANWYSIRCVEGKSNVPISPGQQEKNLNEISEAENFFKSINWSDCYSYASAAKFGYEHDQLNNSSAYKILQRLRLDIITAIQSRMFLEIAKDRNNFIDKEDLLGSSLTKAFPSAINDIRESGNCMAAECNTAAVFHLMRTVEWGLRALCFHLGFKKMCSKFKATGNSTYIPIEYLEWDKILNQLQDRVDDRIAKIKRGPKKQNDQEFYYPLLQDIRGIRDAWRNHVMHTRAEYSREDAIAIMEHVQRIMNKLSERISEA